MMHAQFDADALLALWESAVGRPAPAREDALLRALFDAVPQALGARNASLMEIHRRLFGREVELLSHCPSCGTAAEFRADSEALMAQAPVVDAASPHCVESHGHRVEFRLPVAEDVAAASGSEDFVPRLLERCVLACTREAESVPVPRIPVAVLDAISQRMEALDPGASVSFSLECPECSTRWDARLDVGQLLWQKVQAAAEHLLLDVDALARVYGWTELEVLRLNPLRRAAYLQMVSA